MSIREILKKNKLIFSIWNVFYQRKLAKIEKNKITGKYTFIDRKKKSENLCIVLSGYKSFLWNDVFNRFKKIVPQDMDVCVVTAGKYCDEMVKICEENNWSYLSVEENKVTLAQNIAITLYPEAKYIYKIDEDMFLTNGFFENLKDIYLKVLEDKKYKVGFVAPIINVNGYSYRRLLEKMNLLDDFKSKFGNAYLDATPGEPIIENGDIAQYLWGKNNNINSIDEISSSFMKDEINYTICPVRFSIGAIMMPRETWEKMGKFNVYRGSNMGYDEVQICQYCMSESRVVVVSENCLVGHFSYGNQTEKMKKYYSENPEIFSYKNLK